MGNRLRDLQQAIDKHPGSRANAEWARLRRMHNIFAGNYRELDRLLYRASTDFKYAMDIVQNVQESEVQEQFFDELDRLLQNAVAAAGALIDHTRKLVGAYPDTAFRAEYERRKDEVIQAPSAAFIKCLRNYMVHYSLPSPQQTVSIRQNGFESKVQLVVPTLLEWDRWDARARKYLVESGEHLVLERPIVEYGRIMDELYNWLFAQFDSLHGDETDAVNELIDEYNRVLTGRA